MDLKAHEVVYRDQLIDGNSRITTASCHESDCPWEVVVDDECHKKGHHALLLGLGHQALKARGGL
jgi:hypothetical protein